jgi:hypothetical protein
MHTIVSTDPLTIVIPTTFRVVKDCWKVAVTDSYTSRRVNDYQPQTNARRFLT